MLTRVNAGTTGWLEEALTALRVAGCAVVEDVLDGDLLAALRDGLEIAYQGVLREVGRERLERAGEVGVARLPMRFAPVFYRLLEVSAVVQVIDATVSPTAVLHLQNGLVLPPLDRARHADLFQLNYHMDFRRVLNGYLCSVNTLFAVDDDSPPRTVPPSWCRVRINEASGRSTRSWHVRRCR